MIWVELEFLNDFPNGFSQTLETFFGRQEVMLSIMDPTTICGTRSWVSDSSKT